MLVIAEGNRPYGRIRVTGGKVINRAGPSGNSFEIYTKQIYTFFINLLIIGVSMEKELLSILKAMADESRLRILCLLNQRELCVCEIEEVLKTSQSNISRHLTKLKDKGIIASEKQARFVIHRIDRNMTDKYPFIQETLNQASKMEKYKEDIENLSKIGERCGLSCKA